MRKEELLLQVRRLQSGTLLRFWNSPQVGVPLWLAGAAVLTLWHFHTPPPGYAIGALAVVAGVISVREVHVLGKVLWVVLLGLMCVMEFHAIRKDREDNRSAEEARLSQERQSFNQVLSNENTSFRRLLNDDQRNFEDVLSAIIVGEEKSRASFDAIVASQRDLFKHENELANENSGTLVPANTTTPHHSCLDQTQSGFALNYGDNTAIITSFLHVIMSYEGQPLITLFRLSDGSIRPVMDVREADGKIVARLDQDGYLIGSRLAVKKPNKSSLLVYDSFGNKALNIEYLNRSTMSINGYIFYAGRSRDIQLRNLHYACSFGSSVDVLLLK